MAKYATLILCLSTVSNALIGIRLVSAHVYTSTDYGFSVDIPRQKNVCFSVPPDSNDGVIVGIAANRHACPNLRQLDQIRIFGAFNIPYDAANTTSLAELICSKRGFTMSDIHIQNHILARCNNVKVPHGTQFSTLFLREIPGSDRESWVYYTFYVTAAASDERVMLDLLKDLLLSFKELPYH